MKNVIRLTFMLLIVPMVASAQFSFQGVFPADSSAINSHGVAIDAAGKIWSAPYFSTLDAENNVRFNPVQVYNADGTPASFSPIIGTTVADTLLRFGPITGVSLSSDGTKIYVGAHGFRTTAAATEAAPNPVVGGIWNSSVAYLHVIDATTGAGVEVVNITYMRTETASHAPNRPAVTDDGFVVLSFVFPASPIVVLDPSDNWSTVQTVTNDKKGFSRSLEVSGDGTMIFNPNTEPFVEGGAPGHIEVLKADDIFSEFTAATPLATASDPGAIARLPGTNIVFASGAGTGNAPLAEGNALPNRYFGYSLNSGQVVSTFDWNYGESVAYKIPRALAFSPDGLTAVAGSFSNSVGALQRFTAAELVSVERTNEQVSGFALEQNYPNPFNPTTRISYTLADAGFATVRVYDMLGRVVATLVNQDMPAGTHSINFDASALSSGIYMYELSSGNVRLTNKMTLVK